MKKGKYLHAHFKCPKLGLLLETDDEELILQKMKDIIVKQLTEMSLKRFRQYCTIEKRSVDWYNAN